MAQSPKKRKKRKKHRKRQRRLRLLAVSLIVAVVGTLLGILLFGSCGRNPDEGRGPLATAIFLFLVVKLLAIASMKEPPVLPASLEMISPGYQEVIK